MKNNKFLNRFIFSKTWESFLEDLKALNSKVYLKNIRKARLEKRRFSEEEVKKILKITSKKGGYK
jgi:hypothetical protein